MPKKKIYDPANTLNPEANPTVEQRLKEGPVNVVPPGSGLYHTRVVGPDLNYKVAPSENVINNDGSYIVLGRDRPSSNRSGYGAKGAQNANSIDLVVGRMASADGGRGPKPGTSVDNSFGGDAARVYISQLTDIDKNFGLATTSRSWLPGPRSGIAIKADGVRIIGREGIKIVTGPGEGFKGFPDGRETNSLGGKIGYAPPIELIAGNYVGTREIAPPGISKGTALKEKVETLQPLTMGLNTKQAMKELSEIVGEIWSAVFNLALLQANVNAAVGVDPVRPWVPAAVAAATPVQFSWVINSLYQTRVNKLIWESHYLIPSGYKYICSRNVSTT